MKLLFIYLSKLAVGLLCVNAYASNQLPLSVFYEDPLLSNVSISPDGKKILGIRYHDGKTLIMVHDIANKKSFYPMSSDNIKYKFNWVRWAENSKRVLLSVRFSSKERGLVFSETRLISLDAEKTAKSVNLYRPNKETLKNNPGWISQFQDNIICTKASEPDFIWVSVDRDTPNAKSVYKVNVNNGKPSLAARDRANTIEWYADRNCDVRISQHYDDRTRTFSYRYLASDGKWRDAWRYVAQEEPPIRPIGFDSNPNIVYILADNDGYQALYKVDLTTPNLDRELVYHQEGRDISGRLIYSEKTKRVVGLYIFGSGDKSIFWDDELKNLQAGIDKSFPESRNYIISVSRDERRYAVYSQDEKHPGRILMGDRDNKSIEMISEDHPSITPELIPKKQWITYNARDGLKIKAVFTHPITSETSVPPLIVFPHGGPISANDSRFDMFTTYFANKGYAVLQPNFRGSTGRGFDYVLHAIGGYGLEMQDDLEDGVMHLIDKNLIDPKRICIVGASYGGYAALMGVAKTPDLFQCAISIAGFSDLLKIHRRAGSYANANVIRNQIGNDRSQLKETSPVRLVDAIKAPVLLIHGARDTRVSVEQSRDMARQLARKNKVHEYIELEMGTHHLDNLDDRKTIFEAVDKFLTQHLPPK